MNDHKQPASFVFQDFQNGTGFGTGMAAIIGVLQACFGMCCYDAPSHMTEEMKSASKEAPKAIVLAVILGAVTGFAFLVTLCFCIGDIESTANTSTGVPVIQIIYDSTDSIAATCVLSTLISVIVIVAGNNILAEGSRAVYAFARDNGLPFSKFFSTVESKSHVPVNAVLLTLAVQLALGAIEFGTTTGFQTVIAISTEGFCKSPTPHLTGFITYQSCRHVIRNGSPKPTSWLLYRPRYQARWAIRILRTSIHRPQHHRTPLPSLCGNYFQLPQREPGQSRVHELH